MARRVSSCTIHCFKLADRGKTFLPHSFYQSHSITQESFSDEIIDLLLGSFRQYDTDRAALSGR